MSFLRLQGDLPPAQAAGDADGRGGGGPRPPASPQGATARV